MGVVIYVQSTQNKNFTLPLEYLKKEVKVKVNFLHEDKHQSCLQIATVIFGAFGQA